MITKERVTEQLDDARARTLRVLDRVDDADQERQVSPLMSPLAWDLAHIAHYEELWLQRRIADTEPTDARFDDLYDAFTHPRRERAALPILDAAGARAFARDVRDHTLAVLDHVDLDGSTLTADAFVYGMVIQHEHQHRETMLATCQLLGDERPVGAGAATIDPAPPSREVACPGGAFVMGAGADPWALDNERAAHEVDLAPFLIDETPVTNAQYVAFVDDGGYRDPRHWSPAGWAWREEAGLEHPQFWSREGERSWSVQRFGHRVAPVPDEPVQHVCWYEAEAYARWAGRRLPSEAEWEYAASWAPDGVKRRYPWGDDDAGPSRANLGELADGPDARSRDGASAWGCVQMLGDVWEWTSSSFGGYPGFRAHPYREYSEVFFGDEYKVLRGGSWATHPGACRATFRNWDYPIRRQIFCGFRCARDA